MVSEKETFAQIIDREFPPESSLEGVRTPEDLKDAEVLIDRKIGEAVLRETHGSGVATAEIESDEHGIISSYHDKKENYTVVDEMNGEETSSSVINERGDQFDNTVDPRITNEVVDDVYHIPEPRQHHS
jgi:hypothetical protein